MSEEDIRRTGMYLFKEDVMRLYMSLITENVPLEYG